MSKTKINLACGPVFVDKLDWTNFDFVAGKGVQKANLLDRLPLPDASAQLVYSSHFLEHIPKPQVGSFLKECLRILKPGGVIRLVFPDLENMARAYLQLRDEAKHTQADFLVMEMIDQCVRRHPGGELGEYYQKLHRKSKNLNSELLEDIEMIEFIKYRTGEKIVDHGKPILASGMGGTTHKLKSLFSAIMRRMQRYWIQAVIQVLPSAFRAQNVSFAEVGERHHWIWDFHQMKQALDTAGFISVQRLSADSSAIADFPFYPLDLNSDGQPRKGAESIYIEARKSF